MTGEIFYPRLEASSLAPSAVLPSLDMARYRVNLTVDSNVLTDVLAQLRKAQLRSTGVPEGVVESLKGSIRLVQLPLAAPEAVALQVPR